MTFYRFPINHLFWASVLIVLGSMLTHTNRTWNGKNGGTTGEKTILTDKEVAFETGTFYKQDQELVEDEFEVGFGNAKIYYDNAEMLGDSATLKIEVGFGNAAIYVPQHWRVDLKVEKLLWCSQGRCSCSPNQQNLDYPWRRSFRGNLVSSTSNKKVFQFPLPK